MNPTDRETGQCWVPRDGGHYCQAHDYAFPRGEVCDQCTVDPGPDIDGSPVVVVDTEALAAENEVRSVARTAKRIAEELSAGTGMEQSIGAKYYDTYLKSMRLWREMRTERKQVEHDEKLVEHDRRMAGLRGSN